MARGVEARRIAYSLAADQHGVLARRQLRRRGLSDGLIDGWLGVGHLLGMLPGVYALGRPATSAESLWMAGVLYGGPTAILAGEAAAAAWGFGPGGSPVEVARAVGLPYALRGTPPHRAAAFRVRRGRVEPGDVAWIGPVPVMEPARLLIDLAGRLHPARLRRRFIEAGRAELLTPSRLARIPPRSRGFNGRRRLLALCESRDPETGRIRSVLEGEFKLLCAEQGLPSPLTNQRVGRYEVDCLWPEARLAVELDGRRFHEDPVAIRADTEKTRALRSLGYRVRRFTWLEVTERPEWVANEIRKELGSIHP